MIVKGDVWPPRAGRGEDPQIPAGLLRLADGRGLSGSHARTVGVVVADRELMAAYVSKVNACDF
jgi:hypothetical protein